uniref:Unc-5 family C-terminal like n=1 Tax=Sphenodon punctatus TaxID=8508 RepID=A0A8D0H4M7_SPHPU
MERFLEQSLLAQLSVTLVLVSSILLLVKCLHSWCPTLLCLGCARREHVSFPNLETLSPSPCPNATLEEVEGFYQELYALTGGKVVMKQLLSKVLVYVGKEVDHKGGCLMLPDMGISLTVPPALGRAEKVSLVLVWDLADSPQLSSTQALISPLVYCGPHGTAFQKPCLLMFKHCWGNATQARGYTSNTDLLGTKTWHSIQEREGLFTYVLEAPWKAEAQKWLQLAIFCSPLATSQSHLQIRVYFLNNTSCALQWAVINFEGSSVVPVQLFYFTGRTKDMCLVIKYVSDGKSTIGNLAVILVWKAVRPSPLERELALCLNLRDSLWLKVLGIFSSSRIPHELFEQLQMLLEPISISGNEHVYFSCQQSPAAATLEIFEEQNGSLKYLYNTMVAIDRLDCASAIESYLNGITKLLPVEAYENQGLEMQEEKI